MQENQTVIESPPSYCQLSPNDMNGMVEAMLESNLSVFRLKSKAIYTAICKDSFRRYEVIIVAAKVDKSVAGFVINVLDWARFTTNFTVRHPLLAPAILSARYLRKLDSPTQGSSIGDFLNATPIQANWRDSSPKIAKIVCLGVGSEFRGRGIAAGLLKHMVDLLTEKGVIRYDARLEYDNIASARMLQKAGFIFVADGPTVFSTREIPGKT